MVDKAQKVGERGPKSSLETKTGSTTGASAGEAANFEGNVVGEAGARPQEYSVQCHTEERGVFIEYATAASGDEAAQKVREKFKGDKGYRGLWIRGVDVASAPDPNSMGGERDASIMIANAGTADAFANPMGTEANRKATEELGKADIKELGQ